MSSSDCVCVCVYFLNVIINLSERHTALSINPSGRRNGPLSLCVTAVRCVITPPSPLLGGQSSPGKDGLMKGGGWWAIIRPPEIVCAAHCVITDGDDERGGPDCDVSCVKPFAGRGGALDTQIGRLFSFFLLLYIIQNSNVSNALAGCSFNEFGPVTYGNGVVRLNDVGQPCY